MPELPDITIYLEALEPRIVGQPLVSVDVANPFVLRTVDPPLSSATGRHVTGLRRLGKRIVLELDDGYFLAIHLMIAGRLRWRAAGVRGGGVRGLLRLAFPSGMLVLTEAGTKRRAALHFLRGDEALRSLDRGGIDVLASDRESFAARLRLENHTVKRALTDPRLFSGVGNAYSDEILHRAHLSPMTLTSRLDDAEVARLHSATRDVLLEWIGRLRAEAAGAFPEKVTAFRPQMAVHGKFRQPCPVCGSPVQRIRYADNETNYCARCQTGGRLLADRALSRLLREDWPRSLDDVE